MRNGLLLSVRRIGFTLMSSPNCCSHYLRCLSIQNLLAWFEISVSVLVLAVGFWYRNRQYCLFIGHFISPYWQYHVSIQLY